jgi:ectoine hydroxylase-related dioxygenase (phytanoyl-CoA dioxygenase family)
MSLDRDYVENGFVVLRGACNASTLDRFEAGFLDYIHQRSGRRFASLHGPDIAEFLAGDRAMEQALYEGVRRTPLLEAMCTDPEIARAVTGLIGEPSGLLEKIVLRIDLPMVLREVAVWHQDYFYVRGNLDTVTAWMPLQDTPFELGCLMVMPGSHELGPVPHDRRVLGKRDFASGIFGREVRYVEMKRGDALLFNALLFHSSGLNVSSEIRYSVQARYSPLSQATDPAMGRLIPLREDTDAIA